MISRMLIDMMIDMFRIDFGVQPIFKYGQVVKTIKAFAQSRRMCVSTDATPRKSVEDFEVFFNDHTLRYTSYIPKSIKIHRFIMSRQVVAAVSGSPFVCPKHRW